MSASPTTHQSLATSEAFAQLASGNEDLPRRTARPTSVSDDLLELLASRT